MFNFQVALNLNVNHQPPQRNNIPLCKMSLSPASEHSFDEDNTSSFVYRFPGICITLKGKLPPELIDTQVPLQISISLPEPYRSFLQPVVNQLSGSLTSKDFVETEEQAEADEDIHNFPEDGPSRYPQAPDLPCLTLPPTFDRHASDSWIKMYKSIGVWMEQFGMHRDVRTGTGDERPTGCHSPQLSPTFQAETGRTGIPQSNSMDLSYWSG
ncbi:hypothetical protein PM082_018361 [Marasmius tenuissimus]|nr:hypothetical protein PM082_018361 [Marasmius tenuissimus]